VTESAPARCSPAEDPQDPAPAGEVPHAVRWIDPFQRFQRFCINLGSGRLCLIQTSTSNPDRMRCGLTVAAANQELSHDV
jgi:hypothetical protein